MSRTITDVRIELVPDGDGDISWLDQSDAQMGEGFEAQAAERKRMLASGEISIVGIRVTAEVEVFVPHGDTPEIGFTSTYTLSSPGVWSVESDSGDDYFREIADDELPLLLDTLRADGFDETAISEATSGPIAITPA